MEKLPIQKVSSKDKTKKWFKDCTLAAVSMALSEVNNISLTNEEKQTNLNLYDGIVDVKELKKHFDTMKVFNANYTPSFKNFAVIRDKIDLLHGEYLERNEEYGVAVTDVNSLSIKSEERRQKTVELLQDALSGKIKDKEKLRESMRALQPDRFMSTLEKSANKLLNIIKKTNDIPRLKTEGMREALILGQAIFYVGVRNDNIFVRRCNPLNTYTVRSGNSNNVKDAEIVAEVRYLPRGKIIDEYGEYIKTKSVFSDILQNTLTSATGSGKLSAAEYNLYHQAFEGDNAYQFLKVGKSVGNTSLTDSEGNIRVVDVSWKGFRKIYKRKYYDEDAEVKYDYVSEYYTVNKDEGEELTVRYVAEWYKATLIGGELIVGEGVKEPRVISPDNPFESYSGYVGGYFNVVNNKSRSMVSLISPYVYLINLLFARAEDILSKNFGKIIELDLHNIPDGWDVPKVMRYMKQHGVRVKDSFKAGNKGIAQSKLAGMYNTSSKPLDMEVGSSIVHILDMIAKAEEQISKITGITPQRLGSISTRELVGNVERSRVSSSHITEYWFDRYEQIMLDLNYLLLNTGRQLLKSGVAFQAILDDYSYSVFEGTNEDFSNAQIDLFPVNTRKFKKLVGILENAVVQGLPNGQITYSELIKIFKTNNSFELIVEAQKLEDEKERKAKDAAKSQNEADVAKIEATTKLEMDKIKLKGELELQLESIRAKSRLDIKTIELDAKDYTDERSNFRDDNSNGIKDNIEIEKEKMSNEVKNRELNMKQFKDEEDIRLKEEELRLKEKEIVARQKSQNSSKPAQKKL